MTGGGPPDEPGAREDVDPAADTPAPGTGEALPLGLGNTAAAGATAPVPARKRLRGVRSGDLLGRYELGDELGEGGMATVYRARDRELRRDVAVKVLFPHLARRAEIVRRFHREARAAAGLEHRNILRIYDVGGGEAEEPPYIVMELIRGRTLLQEIEQRGAMLAEVAACVGALLGDALAAAHAAGIIHRDVKPANVLIAPGGRLLLADFGVARLETEDSLVTRTGALLGTPAYMSPEQASGDIATARSDLYSLGATLYQLATGALPYAGTPAKVMSMIAAGSMVSPVRRRPACGADLSRQIERLMATDPAARPATATALAGELRQLVADSGLGDPNEELAAYFADAEAFLRARTPIVVGALVAAASAAIADDRLPRAMALADRASALMPADPAVAALIHAVTEGGHASRRKRALALSGLALAVVTGGVALGWQLTRASDAADRADPSALEKAVEAGAVGGGAADPRSGAGATAPAGAADPTAPGGAGAADPRAAATGSGGARDAADPSTGPGGAGGGADATTAALGPGGARGAADPRAAAAVPGGPGGAADPRSGSVARTGGSPGSGAVDPRSGSPVRDGGARGRGSAGAPASGNAAQDARGEPAGGGSAAADSAPPVPVAAQPALAVDAGSPAPGHLVVRNDVWCNIWIDGDFHGNRRNEPIEVAAGRHAVRCVNPQVGEWKQDTEVAPGATRTLVGTLLRELQVTLEVDATIDGKAYARGVVVRLKPGILEVIAGGKKQFITFRGNCRLTDTPELGCYL